MRLSILFTIVLSLVGIGAVVGCGESKTNEQASTLASELDENELMIRKKVLHPVISQLASHIKLLLTTTLSLNDKIYKYNDPAKYNCYSAGKVISLAESLNSLNIENSYYLEGPVTKNIKIIKLQARILVGKCDVGNDASKIKDIPSAHAKILESAKFLEKIIESK